MDFSLLVKPAGADCNLACGYCFYREKSALYRHAPRLMMEDKVLRRLLDVYRGGHIAFQGGEPTLMGLDFFRRAQELSHEVDFSLQTNGTLLDGDWARFLRDHHWLVGLSVDGPEAIHNRFRQHYDLAKRGYDALVAAGAMVNTLTLVSAANIDHPQEVYRFVRDEWGSLNQQYIECTTPPAFAIDGEKWGDFLIGLFDTWLGDGDAHRVSIRLFDTLVARMVYGRSEVCQFAGNCCNYLVVEWNGDIYPCDFHVTKDLRLGNILTDDLETVFRSPKFREFGRRKRNWSAECAACPYLPFCQGDCPKNRDPLTRQSRLCSGYKRFFAHALPILRTLIPSA
jgi:uncharacterized protein